ncbi:unnamed protein product [Natator depressus]
MLERKLVAFGSRILSKVERRFSACEKEVLALVWVLQHWEYIVGVSPVILKTPHTPVKYVLSGKIKGRVSILRLAEWTLNLLNKNVKVKIKDLSTILYALLVQGEEHEYPVLYEDPEPLESPFKMGISFEQARDLELKIWYVDGSCFYHEGKLCPGYAVRQVDIERIHTLLWQSR